MKKNFNTSFPILVIVLFACMGSFTSQALKINFGRVDAHKELAESNWKASHIGRTIYLLGETWP